MLCNTRVRSWAPVEKNHLMMLCLALCHNDFTPFNLSSRKNLNVNINCPTSGHWIEGILKIRGPNLGLVLGTQKPISTISSEHPHPESQVWPCSSAQHSDSLTASMILHHRSRKAWSHVDDANVLDMLGSGCWCRCKSQVKDKASTTFPARFGSEDYFRQGIVCGCGKPDFSACALSYAQSLRRSLPGRRRWLAVAWLFRMWDKESIDGGWKTVWGEKNMSAEGTAGVPSLTCGLYTMIGCMTWEEKNP